MRVKGKGGAAKRGRTVSVNMKGVDVKKILPEDDYLVKVEEVTEEIGGESKKPYLLWKLKVAEGEYEGTTLYHKTSLQPQALFNLKGTLIALGVPVPDSVLNLNLDKMEGLEMGVSVEKGTYEGKPKNEIVEVFPWEAAENAEDEDDDVDLESMNLQELLDFAKENGIDLSDKDKKKANKVREAISEALEDEGEEEGNTEEDEDEDIDLEAMNLEELVELAKEREIDLSSLFKKDLKKDSKVRAVIAEALEEEEGEEEEEIDLDTLNLEQLLTLAKEQEVDLSKLSKKDLKKASKVRAAIAAALSEE